MTADELGGGRRVVEMGLLRADDLRPTRTGPSAPATDLATPIDGSAPPDPGDGSDAVTGGSRIGRYQLLSLLGRGGMGEVHQAWDSVLRRKVAIKILLWPEAKETVGRFRREAHTVARLSHPHIVPIHAMGSERGRPYLVMEHLDAQPLHELRLPPREAVRILYDVCGAIHHAHEHGVVHRDLKPQNLMRDRNGHVWVLDFGIAQTFDGGAGLQTAPGVTVGTPAYMSPEQAAGEPVDARSDVYGLGATLWHLLADRPPFQDCNPQAVLARKAAGVPPPTLRGKGVSVDRDLETIVMKCLEPEPDRRYATAQAVGEDLRRWLEGEPVLARPASGVGRVFRRIARRRALFCGGAATVLLTVVLGGVALGAHARRAAAERERETAERAEALTKEGLRKAGLAQSVLLRWLSLAPTVERIEAVRYQSTLPPAERKLRIRELWGPVESFMKETPADATSQAAMRAFAGWARALGGDERTGCAWMRRAGSLDPDLPHGPFFEAIHLLSRALDEQPLPLPRWEPTGMKFDPQGSEEAAIASYGGRVKLLLGRAMCARLWREDVARDLRPIAQGILAMRLRQYDVAERLFTQAAASVCMATWQRHVLCGRARARFLQGKFDEALADLRAVRAGRPESARIRHSEGLVLCARAMRREAGGDDPRPDWTGALACFRETIRLQPVSPGARGNLALVRLRLASLDAAQGKPIADGLREALADMETAAAVDTVPSRARAVLGGFYLAVGRLEQQVGTDPRQAWVSAVEAFGAAIAGGRNPGAPTSLEVAKQRAASGADPWEAIRPALLELRREGAERS